MSVAEISERGMRQESRSRIAACDARTERFLSSRTQGPARNSGAISARSKYAKPTARTTRGPPTSVIPRGLLAPHRAAPRRTAPHRAIWKSAKISIPMHSRESYRRWILSLGVLHTRSRSRARTRVRPRVRTHTRYVSMSEHGLSRSTIVAIWRGLLSAFLFPTSFLAPRLRWWVEEEEMQTGQRGGEQEDGRAARPPTRYDTARFFDDR